MQVTWLKLNTRGCVGGKSMPWGANGKMLCIHAPMKIIDIKYPRHFG